jgi:predicted aconitase with swiveling domain
VTTVLGRTLVPGDAEGEVLFLDEPVSFWGGVDPRTGTVIDPHHPQRDVRLTGRVVVMATGRGSSSSSSVLAESIRLRTAPSALILTEPDIVLAVGALVAEELYGVSVPIVTIGPGDLDQLRGGMVVVRATPGRAKLDTRPG